MADDSTPAPAATPAPAPAAPATAPASPPAAPTVSAIAPAAPAAPPAEHPVTLREFCIRHSETEKGVELLGAFHAMQSRAAPVMPQTPTVWRQRLAAFAATPTR